MIRLKNLDIVILSILAKISKEFFRYGVSKFLGKEFFYLTVPIPAKFLSGNLAIHAIGKFIFTKPHFDTLNAGIFTFTEPVEVSL
jgi:hypothetical protein